MPTPRIRDSSTAASEGMVMSWITVIIILSACRRHGCVERVSIPVPATAATATTPHSRHRHGHAAGCRTPSPPRRGNPRGVLQTPPWKKSCLRLAAVIRTLESFVLREGRKGEKRPDCPAAAPSPGDSSQPDGVSLPVHSAAANAGVKRFCVRPDIVNEWYSLSTLDSPNPDVAALTHSIWPQCLDAKWKTRR